MIKKLIVIVVLCLLANNIYGHLKAINSIVVPNVPVPIIPSPEPQEVTVNSLLDSIRIQDVKLYVEKLSSKDFAGRGTGEEGNRLAANYIADHLSKHNIPVMRQKFNARNGGIETENIIGIIEPSNPSSNDVIVIGAHFDHLGSNGSSYYPGADDNASGTAGLMAIGSALSQYKHKLKHTILLQFYSAEELGLIGSKYYTNNPLFPKDQPDINKHIAMINMDMIGYLRKNYTPDENMTTYKDYSLYTDSENFQLKINLKNIVNNLSTKYTFARNISGYRPGGSDHAPFYGKGIPVVFLHTGSHPHYHKTSDTPEKLNYAGLVSVTQLALEIALAVDNN